MSLINSKNNHLVEFSATEVSHAEVKGPYINASDGVGTSSHVYINKSETRVEGLPTTFVATIAHELAGHSYDIDKGKLDDTRDVRSGVANKEVNATQAENLFRRSAGLSVRSHYGKRVVPNEGPQDEN